MGAEGYDGQLIQAERVLVITWSVWLWPSNGVCYFSSMRGWYGESIFGNCWRQCCVLTQVLGRLQWYLWRFRRYKLCNWILTLKPAAFLSFGYFKTKRWLMFWQDTSPGLCFDMNLNFWCRATSAGHQFLLRMVLMWTATARWILNTWSDFSPSSLGMFFKCLAPWLNCVSAFTIPTWAM